MIEAKMREIVEKLNLLVALPKLSAAQRENFRDLQEELRVTQKCYRTFSDPDSGT